MTAAHCEVKLHGFRRTQDGVVVSFVVHPSEVPQCLALDPLGQRYMIGIAAIGDDEQPISYPSAVAVKAGDSTATEGSGESGEGRTHQPSPPHSQSAAVSTTPPVAAVVPERAENRDASTLEPPIEGMRAAPEYDTAIVKRAGILSSDKRFWAWINVADAAAAAAFIRRACAVESRRDLATNTGAAIRFQGLLDEFEASTGRRAEMRS